MSNLWNLQFGGTDALPFLVRGESRLTDSTTDLKDLTNFGVYGDQSNQVKDPINVVTDFPWTASPKTSRQDVPKIQLIEQRIVLNSTVTNMIYSTLASADNISSVGNTVEGLLDRFFPKKDLSEQDDLTETEIAALEAEEASNKKKLRDKFESILQAGLFKTFSSNVLKPYEGLYATEYTGFNYYFPYLEDEYREVANTFGEPQGNIASSLANLASDFADLTNVLNVAKPGTYIEKSKQFTMGEEGRSLSFSFPLLNTGSFEDVRRNWQLLFGLVYQNRPGRVSKSIIDQPVIYEVQIPGMAYMPYAYISNLSVKFMGNRRDMEFDVPIMSEGTSGGNSSKIGNIKTTVPDAYQVNITVKGLNEETRNFLYASVKKDKLTVNKAVEG